MIRLARSLSLSLSFRNNLSLMKSSPPMFHLFLPSDLKHNFKDWKEQRLPSEIAEVVREVAQGQKPQLIPGLVLHFSQGIVDEYLASLPPDTAFDNWYRWTMDNSTNVLHIMTMNIPL